MFRRIDHTELVTDQPERTERFYTEILGFKVRERDRVEKSGVGVPLNLLSRIGRHHGRAHHL
jgi:catechol 2,3-dioxygenase-like lactoylglutathione lyase family enzyme